MPIGFTGDRTLFSGELGLDKVDREKEAARSSVELASTMVIP